MAEEPKELREYPQGDECWLLLVRKLRGYLEDENGQNYRPYTVLLYEISPQTILLDKVCVKVIFS